MKVFLRKRPGRLLLYTRQGESLERRVPSRLLERLRDRARARGGQAARLAWERVGMLATIHLLPLWPSELLPPRRIYLRSPSRFLGGLSLQVELASLDSTTLSEYADGLCADLAGRPLVPPLLEADEVGESDAWKDAGTNGRPEGPPGPSPVMEGVAEPGNGLEPEELPWILPGDRLYSSRLGPCRVRRVESDGRTFQLRLSDGSLRLLGAEEILADFRRSEVDGPLRARP